jgi:hypothetical protein
MNSEEHKEYEKLVQTNKNLSESMGKGEERYEELKSKMKGIKVH